MTASVEQIARVCYEANRAYCITLNDFSQLPWEAAPPWQRDSCIAGVRFRIENPDAPPRASHENWMKHKQAEGWVFGEKKSGADKTHPCMVPFDQLPEDQQRKDVIFALIVAALTMSKEQMGL